MNRILWYKAFLILHAFKIYQILHGSRPVPFLIAQCPTHCPFGRHLPPVIPHIQWPEPLGTTVRSRFCEVPRILKIALLSLVNFPHSYPILLYCFTCKTVNKRIPPLIQPLNGFTSVKREARIF